MKVLILVFSLFLTTSSLAILEPRFVWGNTANNGQYLYHVNIRSHMKYGEKSCSGALIGNGQWVLTAAQCVQG